MCLRHNLNIKVVQIDNLNYTKFSGSRMAAPKVGGPVRPTPRAQLPPRENVSNFQVKMQRFMHFHSTKKTTFGQKPGPGWLNRPP